MQKMNAGTKGHLDTPWNAASLEHQAQWALHAVTGIQ